MLNFMFKSLMIIQPKKHIYEPSQLKKFVQACYWLGGTFTKNLPIDQIINPNAYVFVSFLFCYLQLL